MGDTATTKPRTFRVTSFDVAAEAGVSQSTVSRALAGDPVVSEATRARVFEAARRLNYAVDENAARLRSGRTATLAVVVICRPDEDRKDLNPFTYALLGTVCAAASATDSGFAFASLMTKLSIARWRGNSRMMRAGLPVGQPSWD